MKGRANYLCRLRFHSFSASPTFARLAEVPLFRSVERWAKQRRSATAPRSTACPIPSPSGATSPQRARTASGSRARCSRTASSRGCGSEPSRRTSWSSTTTCFAPTLAVKESSYGRVIPEYDTVVLDEAHMLEDVATQYFGLQMSFLRADDLARDVERELSAAKHRCARRPGRGGRPSRESGAALPVARGPEGAAASRAAG